MEEDLQIHRDEATFRKFYEIVHDQEPRKFKACVIEADAKKWRPEAREGATLTTLGTNAYMVCGFNGSNMNQVA